MIFAEIRVRALLGARQQQVRALLRAYLNSAVRSVAFTLKARRQSLTDGLIQWF
jgi:hypothetical protein